MISAGAAVMSGISDSGDVCSKRPPFCDSAASAVDSGSEDIFRELLPDKENIDDLDNEKQNKSPSSAQKRRSQEYELSDSSQESPIKCYRSLRNSNQTKRQLSENNDLSQGDNSLTESTHTADVLTNSNIGTPRNKSVSKKPVVFIYSEDLVLRSDEMIKIPQRASMVASLIKAYGLLRCMRIESPKAASLEELSVFHSEDYLTFLEKISTQDDDEKYDEEAQQFGLSYDCPAHQGVFDYTALVCGGTLRAVQSLCDGQSDVAINWFGGWHHGKRDAASGFCYTNDIVLGILKLKEKFSRVLYVDLDLHHGDGVEDAFCTTNKVMTVSVHKYTVGFFPGTGSVDAVGYGKGKNYSVNIPLKDGIKDAEFASLVCRILLKVKEKFQPEAIVCQCGADGITGDPMESFNLTPLSLGKCVYTLLSWKLPLLLLGGGGYHHGNTARCWAYLTGVVLGKKLKVDLPEHQFLMEYGPDYELTVTPGNMKDQNSLEYLQDVFSWVIYNLNQIT